MTDPSNSSSPLRIAVILAGGAGERFWPLSRRDRPKQLLRLTRVDQSMLAEAVERIAPLIPYERILIITARHLVEPIQAALPALPAANVVGEPDKRNTAGALAYAAAAVLARFVDTAAFSGRRISMAVLTADHRIAQSARFRQTVEAALRAAEEHGALVTIGVVPDRAETGFGYIEAPEAAARQAQAEAGEAGDDPQVLPVSRFREKPDRATARGFVDSGRFYWNSGMFFWTLEGFMDELAEASPAHAEAVRAMADALAAGDEARADDLFRGLPDVSIDYALMEKARNVMVARADFQWDDVGALDALARNLPADAAGNVAVGDPVLIDAKDCIVYNEPGAEAMAVAAVGVEGLAIVVTRDGVLVIPRERAQDVKKVVAELNRRDAGQL
jgi:mannose-1-phosphate guanylyltransferase